MRHWLILLTVQVTTVLFGITITSTAVILPQMRGALSATQDQIAWILTFNLVATAIATPLTGWLSERLGWRRLMTGSVVIFTAASFGCGFVQSLDALLLLRVVQGAAGAPIFPLGQTILLASFPRSHQAWALTMWGVGGVLGPILGPTLGGIIGEWLSWRWIFFLMLPVGLAAGTLASLVLSDARQGQLRRFDFLGFLFIAVAVGSAQLMADRGQRLDWLESTEIVIELSLATVFFYLFVVHITTTRQALFDPAIFADRNFCLGVVVVMIMGMLQYTPTVLFPPLLQDLRGYPDSMIGYLIAARGLGNFTAFFVVAQLTRRSPKLCLFAGLTVQALGGLWMASLDINMTTADVFGSNLLHGIGFGLSYTPMTVLCFWTLPAHLLTQANAVFSLLRMIGSSLFISLTLVLFVQATAMADVALSSLINPFEQGLLLPWTQALGEELGPRLQEQLGREVRRQASMLGYVTAFQFLTLVALFAAPLAFLFVTRPRAAH